MEILKKMNRILMALWMSLFFMSGAVGQDYIKIQAAFDKSYDKESAGETREAISLMKEIYDENSYEINLRLGWLSYSLGNFTESMAYYQKSISLKPFAVEPRFGLTFPASAAGNWELVRQQYLKILEVDPKNAKACYYLGMIYYEWEKYEEAYGYFEIVANLYPFDYDGMSMYAWTSYRLGKLREARVLFNKVLMIRPGDESATNGLKLIQ